MEYEPTSPPARIIVAGRKLFFERGFERVSTDLIAKEAKVSKASLYKYFPTMSDVLMAVVRAEGENFSTGVPVQCESLPELKEALIRYGTQVMGFLNKPDVIQFTLLMHEEVRSHPKIAARFYQEAIVHSHEALSSMIAYGQTKQYVNTRLTAEELAEQLMGMWEGIRWNKTRMGLSKKPYSKPNEWATRCVETLLASV